MMNIATIIGLLNLFLSLLYLGLSGFSIIWQYKIKKFVGVTLYVIQAIIAPAILLLSGLILIFQGWRLDPILQFVVFLQNLLIIYLGFKDIYLMLNSALSSETEKNSIHKS